MGLFSDFSCVYDLVYMSTQNTVLDQTLSKLG